MALEFASTTRLLFIGDSITDCGRREDPEEIGHGYVRMVRDLLRAHDPASAPAVLNTGVSGDCVTDLAGRWQRDVLDRTPDILSIKIGINDVWKNLDGENDGVTIERFMSVYDSLLSQTRTLLPQCKIVLCEPSVIWSPQPSDGNEQLRPYVGAVSALAAKHGAAFVVPLHRVFVEARQARHDIDWAPDGVHPSSSGHMLIARAWLMATGCW